jgi:hypothetical protein
MFTRKTINVTLAFPNDEVPGGPGFRRKDGDGAWINSSGAGLKTFDRPFRGRAPKTTTSLSALCGEPSDSFCKLCFAVG